MQLMTAFRPAVGPAATANEDRASEVNDRSVRIASCRARIAWGTETVRQVANTSDFKWQDEKHPWKRASLLVPVSRAALLRPRASSFGGSFHDHNQRGWISCVQSIHTTLSPLGWLRKWQTEALIERNGTQMKPGGLIDNPVQARAT